MRHSDKWTATSSADPIKGESPFTSDSEDSHQCHGRLQDQWLLSILMRSWTSRFHKFQKKKDRDIIKSEVCPHHYSHKSHKNLSQCNPYSRFPFRTSPTKIPRSSASHFPNMRRVTEQLKHYDTKHSPRPTYNVTWTELNYWILTVPRPSNHVYIEI